jgi:hypothetical protein
MAQSRCSSHDIGSRGSHRSSTTSKTQEMLMLLAASTSPRAIGFVTSPFALTGSATTSQYSTMGPPAPSAPSP